MTQFENKFAQHIYRLRCTYILNFVKIQHFFF